MNQRLPLPARPTSQRGARNGFLAQDLSGASDHRSAPLPQPVAVIVAKDAAERLDREELNSMSAALSVNVFTAPEKAMAGERARPFGPPPAFDAITSTLI